METQDLLQEITVINVATIVGILVWAYVAIKAINKK